MDLMAVRRGLMMRKRSLLPQAYQQVEWVKGNNCLIDTGYVVTVNPIVVAKIAINASGDKDILGFENNTAPSFIVDVYYSDPPHITSWYNRYGPTTSYSFGFQPQKDVAYVYEFGPIVKIDGVVNKTPGEYNFSSNEQTMRLFGARTSHAGVTFYDFMLYDNSALVRNLVPCYRKSDSVIGMYDMITQTFLTSSTGIFTKGPDV